MLDDMRYEKCMVVVGGQDVLKNEELAEKLGEPSTEDKREKWTTAQYRLYPKPADPKKAFEAEGAEDWEETQAKMKKPGKNRFMPENTDTIVKNKERQQNNGRPKLI